MCLALVGIQARGAAVFSVSKVLSDEGPSQQRLEGSMGGSQVETCGMSQSKQPVQRP